MSAKKGFIFIEVSSNADIKEISKYISKNYLKDMKDYCCPVYGKFNIVIEKNFELLKELDDFLTKIRKDQNIKDYILKTTSFLAIKVSSKS
ncbi:MAG: hypothetical protein ACTSRA_11335 [Promethearchaeota archaeon]